MGRCQFKLAGCHKISSFFSEGFPYTLNIWLFNHIISGFKWVHNNFFPENVIIMWGHILYISYNIEVANYKYDVMIFSKFWKTYSSKLHNPQFDIEARIMIIDFYANNKKYAGCCYSRWILERSGCLCFWIIQICSVPCYYGIFFLCTSSWFLLAVADFDNILYCWNSSLFESWTAF